MLEKIVVLDFGSQYAHLIAKRLRLLGYYSEIALPQAQIEGDNSPFKNAVGIILSGGPSSVYEQNVPEFNKKILELTVPILGLCYGHQLLSQCYGGIVQKAPVGEFGFAQLKSAADTQNPLFKNISMPSQVWMSHQDAVTVLPEGFEAIAYTDDCAFAAIQNIEKKRFGLQFHAEVKDTLCGNQLFENFAHLCGMSKNWNQDAVLQTILEQIRCEAKNRKVLLFLSGGVDSTVAFALLNKALGQENVLGLHIDNGFMRKNESAVIAERYKSFGFTNFIVEDASSQFLKAINGLTDPQKKRAAVGETFITVRDEVVSRLNLNENEWLLGQGTLYPDIIESGGTQNSHVIKTHHNRVLGIQNLIKKGLIIEPLKDLYKDEVRFLGKKIGLPDELIFRHPFPGPGLSINVLCSDGVFTEQNELNKAQSALDNSNDAVKKILNAGTFEKIGVLPVKSVGVQGDFRTYRFPAVLQFSNTFATFPDWERLNEASSLITNSVKDVNRTIIELFKKQDCVIQQGFCTKERLDQTREIDAIVLEELKKAGWYTRIFQHLTVNLPFAAQKSHCSIVLRPVVSEDVMTARFARLDLGLLHAITLRIQSLDFVDSLYYDVTNKPPATFGWE